MNNDERTIAAVATGSGGAISIIRVSGRKAIDVVSELFRARSGKNLREQRSFSLQFGTILSSTGELVDEVLVSVFRSPNSYTGEDMVEISCHGSAYVQQSILSELVSAGASMAAPGEFTMRAFMNGKLDLVQAEAVADLISSSSRSSHSLAINQMRGGYSKEFTDLRESLLNFASLIELELDFSEEDVEFADRTKLIDLLCVIKRKIEELLLSFKRGNAIKNGIPVSIIGSPNAGKSTLLNTLLKEDKAIVSEIAGTTRDVIEDTVVLSGITFRFIDTAGIRETTDVLEGIGIERTFEKITKSEIVIMLVDCTDVIEDILKNITKIKELMSVGQRLIIALNKIDLVDNELIKEKISALNNIFNDQQEIIIMSANRGEGVENLVTNLVALYENNSAENAVVITNIRHYDLLYNALECTQRAISGLETQMPIDFIAQDIRQILYYIGSITGEITSDDVLVNIFSKFCIGK